MLGTRRRRVIKRKRLERISMAKKRTPDFGKRRREQAEPAVDRVTVVQRLKALGGQVHARYRPADKGPCEQERLHKT
jgi:hypothetical protein